MSKKTMSRKAQISLEDKERERRARRADKWDGRIEKILPPIAALLVII